MFALKRIREKIWHLHFDTQYDLTMHFLRYQEYYESPKFMKKSVQIVDIMDWYQKNLGKGVFTYPRDWSGFNFPGEKIFELHNKGIEDINRYDRLMLGIAEFIRSKDNIDEFYIIGTSLDDPAANETFNHELAHGLFYSNEDYKNKMTKLVCDMPKKEKSFLFRKLKKMGYSADFFIDECQAYLGTGLDPQLDNEQVREAVPSFEKIFSKFSKGIRKKVIKEKE